MHQRRACRYLSVLQRNRVALVATVVLIITHTGASAMDLTRLDGVVAVAESQYRSRWGLDGYHPHLAIDGNTDSSGNGERTTCWVSDNFEFTHSLAIVFPRLVDVSGVTLHWGRRGGAIITPRKAAVEGLRGDQWAELATITNTDDVTATTISAEGNMLQAVRISQPPDGASPVASRMMAIAEFIIEGEASAPAVTVDAGVLSASIRADLVARRQAEMDAFVKPHLDRVMAVPKTEGFQSVVNRADVERGRRNIATRSWAKSAADGAIRNADWWLGKPDEYIYELVPTGNPRALCPSFEKGCPIHGGARNSFTATLEKPYTWKCSKGGEEWYDGAVVTNPGTGEQVTVHDDGSGWLAPEGFPDAGRRFYFVAAYNYFVLGKLFSSPYEGDGGSEYQANQAVVNLALAYAYTGKQEYAHKAAVMLNRLAELYRFYDGCVEGVSPRQDGYIGQGFEKSLTQNLVLACDLIWDELATDQELLAFFRERGNADYNGDGAVTGEDITYNIQRNLLGYSYEYIHRLMPYMDGDFLMYELHTLATLAHCLRNPEITEEALEGDYGLRVLLTNSWFRDGKYIYDSTGYNRGNAMTPLWIAEWLHGLTAPPEYGEPLDVYHHPHYRVKMLYDFLRYLDCDGRTPQIGDVGGSRSVSLRTIPQFEAHDERALLRLPEDREFYLSRLMTASGGNPEAFRGGRADWWLVFHADEPLPAPENPPAAAVPGSHMFDDGGIAILRAGSDAKTRLHVPFTFSKGAYGHGHTDKLAINVFRYGYDWSADLGYPTTWTDRKYGNWETDTASHWTVMLDEAEQKGNVIGEYHWLAQTPLVDACEASCLPAYPKAELYRRTVGIVKDAAGEPLYVVDIFRVAGASTRDYLLHSLGKPEDLTVTLDDPGAAWTHQPQGSLQGADVDATTGRGYSWLHDLYRAQTDGGLTAVWRPTSGSSQPDRYLLTARDFGDVTVEFTMTRRSDPSGDRERAVFVYCTRPQAPGDRKVIQMPVGSFEVGTPVRVRIDIRDGNATMTLDGKPAGGVDVVGAPGDSGPLGYLHYYNYAWEYRDITITPAGEAPIAVDLSTELSPDFWARIDPTYRAENGALIVKDAEVRGLQVKLPGAPGREIIKAQAEGYGLRGRAPMEGHVIVRETVQDPSTGSVFVAVVEPFAMGPRVRSVERVQLVGGADGPLAAADAVALRVVTDLPGGRSREDIILAALEPEPLRTAHVNGAAIRFQGRFGVIATRGGEILGLSLVGGGELHYADAELTGEGDLSANVVEVRPETDTIIIEPADGSIPPSERMIGRHIRLDGEGYVCPSTYTLTGIEPAGENRWALRLNMTQTLAHGVIKSVDAAAGAFATQTPVMKLRVNPGLFNGKPVRAGDGPMHRLSTATEAAFALADAAVVGEFRPDQTYTVYDVGVGDTLTLIDYTGTEVD